MLLELQSSYAGGNFIRLKIQDGQNMKYLGSVFADNAMWVAESRESTEVRMNVAILFLEFMDITFNKEKSSVVGVEWQSGEAFGLARESWIWRRRDELLEAASCGGSRKETVDREVGSSHG